MQITTTNDELFKITTEIHDHKRGEPKFFQLLKREVELTQEKANSEEKYSTLDKQERDLFTHLQARINILHEKSKTHTRQWGIISTILGALLGIAGASISAYYRNKDIKNIQMGIQSMIQLQVEQSREDSLRVVQSYEKLITKLESYESKLGAMTVVTAEKPKKASESWGNYFKRHGWTVWRLCTFQRS